MARSMPDEPVPIRRAAVGCLLVAVAGLAVALLVRPLIFSVAPARGDDAVIVGTLADVSSAPMRREVILARSHGLDGERDAGDGRVQVAVIVAPSAAGGITAVNGSSPVADACPVEVAADRLVDCDARAWTLDGLPLDSADPPLQHFIVDIVDGSVIVDFTRVVGG